VNIPKGETAKLVQMGFEGSPLKVSGAGTAKLNVDLKPLPIIGSEAVPANKGKPAMFDAYARENIIGARINWDQAKNEVTLTSTVRMTEGKKGEIILERVTNGVGTDGKPTTTYTPMVTVEKGATVDVVNIKGQSLLTIDGTKTFKENQAAFKELQDSSLKDMQERLGNELKKRGNKDVKFGAPVKLAVNLTPDDLKGLQVPGMQLALGVDARQEVLTGKQLNANGPASPDAPAEGR